MIRKTLILLLLILAIFSCQKKENEKATPEDVVFTALLMDPGAGLKSTNDTIRCQDLDPVYAMVKIGTTPENAKFYSPAVFRLDGKLYTQAIKLEPGTHWVYEFLIMDDMGTPTDTDDDEIYMATPEIDGDFAQYTNPDVPFSITVTAFAKTEVEVQVLCFEPKSYTSFGFEWFAITEIVIREQCFFGDLCVDDPLAWAGSHYELQSTGLAIDMPALFKIHAYRNGNELPFSPFTNDLEFYDDDPTKPWYGVGYPLCVTYPDNLNAEGELFTFELWILVKNENGFNYELYHTWTFEDNEEIEHGGDGIVDFVVGDCNLEPADLELDWLGLSPQPTIDWEAYNDCVGPASGSAPNVTVYSGYLGGGGGFETPAGLLVDFATGNNTAVTVTMEAFNVAGSLGSMPDAGTDAHTAFDAIVNLGESASYNSSGSDWYYQATFSGLDPAKTYEFVTTANRNGSSYNGNGSGSRWTRFSIIGAEEYTNASSSGSGVIVVSDDVIKMNTGYNTVEGNIVKWSGIKCGADGVFIVLSQNVGAEGPGEPIKSYGLQGFKLTQISE